MLVFVTTVAFIFAAAAFFLAGFVYGVVKATPDIPEVSEEDIIEAFSRDDDDGGDLKN